MNHDHLSGIAPSPSFMNGTMHMHRKRMMMHMTFFWGTRAEILFDGWPGTRTSMYWVALTFIFALSVIVEWLCSCQLIKPGCNNVVAGLVQTFMHCIRVGLANIVMLAVMSFNGGVFLAAVAGHSLGFLLFGSRVFKNSKKPACDRTSDLPPMSC